MNCFYFLFHCNLYDSQREDLNIKARNIVERWDSLSEIAKLIVLFKDMTRILGKFVKTIFLVRRNKLYR